MRLQSPSISELHAFAQAAQTGSYTQAAQALQVTQGAISRAIARLEEHLGFALFERLGRHSVLTAEGQQYLQAIGPALHTIETVSGHMRRQQRMAPSPTGAQHLRLSVPPTLFSSWLIPRLPHFQQQHRHITLSFAPYRRDDPLQAHDIDAWIRIGSHPWPAAVQADYLVGHDLVPICHPRRLPQLHTPEDLLRQPLLAHTNYPDNWAKWFEDKGCYQPLPTPTADFELVGLLVQAVIADMGLAVVQRCLIEEELASGRVAIALRPEQAVLSLTRGYFLCRPSQRPACSAWHDFRHWALQQAQLSPATSSAMHQQAARESHFA